MSASESNEAPGRLELLQAFVNTMNLPAGPDAIGNTEQASEWCRGCGLPPVSNDRERARLRDFREALRELLYANNGEGDPQTAWEGLRPFARGASFGLTIDAGRGIVTLEPGGAGADRAIAGMLAIVYDAVADGTWPRLRACRRSDCRYAYYDHSKNGSRAWCSMAVCGNREKAQRRRARDRAL